MFCGVSNRKYGKTPTDGHSHENKLEQMSIENQRPDQVGYRVSRGQEIHELEYIGMLSCHFFLFVNKIGHTFSRPTCDLIDISRALWRHVSLPVHEMKYVFGSDKEFQSLCNKILNLLIIFSMVGCHRYITVNYKVNELSSGRNRGKSAHHMGFITSFSMMKS